jgi:hypothetical protein
LQELADFCIVLYMDKGVIAFVLVAIVGIAGFFGYSLWKDKQQQASQAANPAAAAVTPGVAPPGAIIIPTESDPSWLLNGVRTARTPQDTAAAQAEWKDAWIPPAGWFGTVQDVTEAKGGGYALRMPYTPPTGILPAEYWVIVVMPDNSRNIKAGDSLVYVGRVDAVEKIQGPMVAICRAVIRDAALLTVNGK